MAALGGEYGYEEVTDRNRTQSLPQCMSYDGAQYVPCRGCRLSSLTAVNVTYACYDVTQLCPTIITNTGAVIDSGGGEDTNEALGGDQFSVPEPYLSASMDVGIDPRSRMLAPKGGKKGGGGGKKGGAGRAANKHRSASKTSGRTDDAANNTNAADDGG